MRLVVLQPSFLPWLGYLDQYLWADVFVLYDDTQFDKHGWRNRNRILTSSGIGWLTVPVKTRGQSKPLNLDIRIDNLRGWRRKMLATLRQSYTKTPYFDRYFPGLETILSRPWETLFELNLESFRWLTESLELPWKVVRSSGLNVSGKRTRRLVALCRELGASDYLTGNAARAYLNERLFEEAEIRVHWHNYRHPHYFQGPQDFVPYLSAVDLLFREGPRTVSILSGSHHSSF